MNRRFLLCSLAVAIVSLTCTLAEAQVYTQRIYSGYAPVTAYYGTPYTPTYAYPPNTLAYAYGVPGPEVVSVPTSGYAAVPGGVSTSYYVPEYTSYYTTTNGYYQAMPGVMVAPAPYQAYYGRPLLRRGW